MVDITVTDAQLVGRTDGPNLWMLATEVTQNGQTRRIAHALPEDTLEWRAAELGIDDPGQLLEIGLYEPYLPPEDPADHPDSLIKAETVGQARAHHLARIQAVRGTGRLRDRNRLPRESRPAAPGLRVLADNDLVPETPLAQLRRELAPDPERVAVLREHVHRTRDLVRQRLAATSTSPEAMRARPSADELRERLTRRGGGGHATGAGAQ